MTAPARAAGVVVRPCIRALLDGIIDYAGFAPPANRDLASAAIEYAFARSTEHGWLLRRFVVPVARLEELEQATEALVNGAGAPWRVSGTVRAGESVADAMRAVVAFNARHTRGEILVDTIELQAAMGKEIEDATAQARDAGVTAYVEMPLGLGTERVLEWIAAKGGRAKVRTGGTAAADIPETKALAGFLVTCAQLGLPFKATAGLHHPLRGEYALTYESKSPTAVMFGFLNVFLAAATSGQGMNERDVTALLSERVLGVFAFTDDAITWRGARWPTSELATMRAERAIAFGSCSFWEPVDGLRLLGLL
jgi:hypothetical protein